MSKVIHGVGQGLRIKISDTEFADVLITNSLPGADGSFQDAAPEGSLALYLNGASSKIYQKIASANALADWQDVTGGGASLPNVWRDERVDAVTGQALAAGVTDPTAWSDNDGGFDGDDAVVGHYILDGNCDLFEITVVTSSTSITLAAAAEAPAADDMFAVKSYLPDPAGQENQAIVRFTGSACIKVADVDFAAATGIVLSGGYAAAAGNPVAGDTVEGAIAKLDGNNDAQDSVLGTAQGALNLGAIAGAGTVVSDNGSVKSAIEELDVQVTTNEGDISTNAGNISTNAGNISTNAGNISTNAGNISTNTGNIGANTSDIADLRTTQGTADGDTNLGAFPGDLLGDAETVKSALTVLEEAAENYPAIETGVDAATVIDSVPVDQFRSCLWLVSSFDEASPGDIKAAVFHGMNNGTSGADATQADVSDFGLLKIGGNFDEDIDVTVSGAGAAQVMNLVVNTTEVGVTYTAVRLGCTPSGY